MTSQFLHPWLHGWSQEKIEMWTQIHRPEEDQTSIYSPSPFLYPCPFHIQHPSGWMETPPLAGPSHHCSDETLFNHLLFWGMERNTCSKVLKHLIFTQHQTTQKEPKHPLKGPVSHCSLRKQLRWSSMKIGEMKVYTLLSTHHAELFFPSLGLIIKTSLSIFKIMPHTHF